MPDFRMTVVPNELHEAINAALSVAFADHPDAEQDRNFLYDVLLEYYDQNGYIPEFTLEKKGPQ